MTICNMSIEAGARAGMIAPDDTTFAYLEGRPAAPTGAAWEQALDDWRTLASDPDATYDSEFAIDVAELAPQVTWGTNPEMVVSVTGRVPDPADYADPDKRLAAERALTYMGLEPGTAMQDIAVDRVFIGSCTNARIEDLPRRGVRRRRQAGPSRASAPSSCPARRRSSGSPRRRASTGSSSTRGSSGGARGARCASA